MKLTSLFFLSILMLSISCQSKKKPKESQAMIESADKISDSNRFGGIQLYTLRDTMKVDPLNTLKEVAEIGYSYIEAANYQNGQFYGMTPEEFKEYLKELNLTPIASHHGDISLKNMDDIIDACKEVGFKYIVIPIPPMGHFEVENGQMMMTGSINEVMDNINQIAARCYEKGIGCLYHNHNFEFVPNEDDVVPMQYFIDYSNPEHLSFELDLYWAKKAGQDPIEWFKKAPGRFKAWHVKDMDKEGRFSPVGLGTIDFKSIVGQKDLAGMEYYFVEQDQTYNYTPLESILISHDHLKQMGFN